MELSGRGVTDRAAPGNMAGCGGFLAGGWGSGGPEGKRGCSSLGCMEEEDQCKQAPLMDRLEPNQLQGTHEYRLPSSLEWEARSSTARGG